MIISTSSPVFFDISEYLFNNSLFFINKEINGQECGKNDTLDLFVSYISIIVFLGFTAYDMQKIKMLSYEFDDEDKIAIIGALELYLDFINIFIDLLRIFGKRD